MDLFDLAARQHGVFSARQATDHDISVRQVRTWLGNGVVDRPLPGVLRIAGAPATWAQRVQTATLWLPGSMASHRTAAALWELRGFESAPVEVLVERWTRRQRPPWLLVHETKDLVGGDLDERRGIACTSLVRTLVDLPAVTHLTKAGDALDHAARYDTSLLPRVRTRHLEVARRGRNGTVKLRLLLTERGQGRDLVDSAFERRALRLIAAGELPRPVTQHQVVDGEFTCYLDLAWPDHRLAMECDSVEHHLSVRAHHWDRERRRRLTRLGWTVLEFTHFDVTKRGPMVLHELGLHLAKPRRP